VVQCGKGFGFTRLLKTPRDGLDYVEHLEGDGETIFEHVCKLKLEGIISKRVDLAYQSGFSRRWLKIKNRAHPAIIRVREAFEEERRRRARSTSRASKLAFPHAEPKKWRSLQRIRSQPE
jgi:ATP-dependent DNA ligase